MIPCIHDGKKKIMKIIFLGKRKDVKACKECESVIASSKNICEVIQ